MEKRGRRDKRGVEEEEKRRILTCWVLWDGNGVEVDDGVEDCVLWSLVLLQLHPFGDCSEIVAEVGNSGWLDPGEDDSGQGGHHCC